MKHQERRWSYRHLIQATAVSWEQSCAVQGKGQEGQPCQGQCTKCFQSQSSPRPPGRLPRGEKDRVCVSQGNGRSESRTAGAPTAHPGRPPSPYLPWGFRQTRSLLLSPPPGPRVERRPQDHTGRCGKCCYLSESADASIPGSARASPVCSGAGHMESKRENTHGT